MGMGWLPVLIGVVAALLLYNTSHPILFVLAIVSAVGSLWSWGIMHNYATEAARRRPGYSGRFGDITESEAESTPDWTAHLNMVFALAGLILVVTAVVIRFF